MRDLMRRLQRLESDAPPGGKLILVSWHSPDAAAEFRSAKRGGERIERRAEETEGAFLARLQSSYTPPSGVAMMFLERD